MPKTPAAEVEAGGRAVRVSSPDRVIYEATERTPEVTKLMVAEYFASVEDGLMRALRDRPTALERWTSGVRPGMKLATSRMDRDADAFYQKRVPKGAPDYLESVEITFPSGGPPRRSARPRSRCRCGAPTWGRSPSTRGPYAAATSTAPTSCASTSTRSRARRSPTRCGSPASRASCSRSSGCAGYPKTSGNRGVHVFVRIEPRWEFVDVRHAAIGFGRELARRDEGVTMNWWKEERGERIFVDFNQNCRDRTIASAYSLRPIPGAPVSTPLTWEELADVTDPREFNLFTVPERLAATATRGRRSTTRRTPSSRCSRSTTSCRAGEMPFPPDYPKMPGEPPRVQPSKKVEEHWDADGNWIGPS